MDDQTAQSIRHWKTHRWLQSHIPFTEAVYSLLSDEPLIELKPVSGRPREWIICRAGTDTPAEMTFAGVFAEADPYETGNLLGRGVPVPPDWDEERVARHAGFKAAYTYAIETYHDREMWDLQHILDEHAKSVNGFNRGDLPRLEWQNGENQHQQWRFFMRTPMFFPHPSRGARPRIPERLHPWVKAAHARSRTYRANPNPPRVRAIEDGELRDIGKCRKKRLEYGDVINIAFSVAYHETPANWGPIYILYDVIRVMDANREAYPLQTDDEVMDERREGDTFSLAGFVTDVAEDPSEPEEGGVEEPNHAPHPPADPPTLTQPIPLEGQPGQPPAGGPTSQALGGQGEGDPFRPPSASQPPLRGSDMDVDDDDSVSVATDATLESVGAPLAPIGLPSTSALAPSKRNVRARLDDDADSMRIEIDVLADPQSSRTRRGGQAKLRRMN